MAQRAIIGINGELLPFSEDVAKLRTPGIDGSAITWVPHNDTLCAALTVRANGTYNAADRNVYGFDYVAVSVPGESVTGKDPTTGQEVVVTKDPTTGEIVETVVPTAIRIVTLPTKTTYNDGEIVNLVGAVIKAYDATGKELQNVPLSEVSISPTTAIYDPTSGGHSSDLDTSPVTQPIPSGGSCLLYDGERLVKGGRVSGHGTVLTAIQANTATFLALAASTSQGGSNAILETFSIDGTSTEIVYSSNAAYTHNGKTVYWGGVSTGTTSNNLKVSGNVIKVDGIPESTATWAAIAWTLIYGEGGDGVQSITVSWPRPGDGAILETSFTINVTGGAT